MTDGAAPADVRIERSIEHLAAEWDDLATRIGAPPFLRPDWFAAWRRAFGAGELQLITLRRAGRLAAVLPLERRRSVVRGLANYHSPVFGPLSEDREATRELLNRALAETRRWLSLPQLQEGDAIWADAQATATEAGCRVLTRPLLHTPVVEVDGDWESHLARLNRRFRKELRRYRRRLEELGSVEFEVADGADGLARRLEEVLAVEGSGWKEAEGTAILSRPETRRFYEEIAAWASERHMLRLFFLRVAGTPIAVDFALESNNIRYMLKGGFDPRYARLAPGTLLLEAELIHAFESGLDRVELGGSDEPYKRRWTETAHKRQLLQAFQRTPLGLADWGTFAYGRPAAIRLLRWRRQREHRHQGERRENRTQ